jgi:hypothetical protein
VCLRPRGTTIHSGVCHCEVVAVGVAAFTNDHAVAFRGTGDAVEVDIIRGSTRNGCKRLGPGQAAVGGLVHIAPVSIQIILFSFELLLPGFSEGLVLANGECLVFQESYPRGQLVLGRANQFIVDFDVTVPATARDVPGIIRGKGSVAHFGVGHGSRSSA